MSTAIKGVFKLINEGVITIMIGSEFGIVRRCVGCVFWLILRWWSEILCI
ncbi:hypothetical protein [uncultured Helicobacter sp.]|nr:hypothetical protein [uncultured Helicobacter sp.]